jgi:Arc/MetJ-type ribon-helix-helix transcriptional regulator
MNVTISLPANLATGAKKLISKGYYKDVNDAVIHGLRREIREHLADTEKDILLDEKVKRAALSGEILSADEARAHGLRV